MSADARTTPTVSVVILNWNGGDALLECLASVRAQSHPPDEIVLVDNGSEDGSFKRATGRFPGLLTVRHTTNLGYGAGVNRGVARASGAWVALLNNDALADREWLAAMLATAATSPEVGMVACKIYLDRAARVLDKIGHRLALDGQNFGRGHHLHDDGQYDRLTSVAWPDGCAALWRREVFDTLGGLDEEFFAYAEDADLGIRARLAGWRCAFAPGAIIEHRHSQTFGAYSARKLYLVERNRLWLAAKYFPLPLLVLNPILWAYRGARTVATARHGKGPWARVPGGNRTDVVKAILRAQLDGWAGVPRQRRKRAALTAQVGAGWERRFRNLLREAHLPLAALARGDVR